MWAVGRIHSEGWIAAICIVAGTGPVRATILVAMYALGASEFLAWASTKGTAERFGGTSELPLRSDFFAIQDGLVHRGCSAIEANS